jgi:hypothetical protein
MRSTYRLIVTSGTIPSVTSSELVALVEELAEAHLDTIEMALELDTDEWASHVRYLQVLRRHAKSLVGSALTAPRAM